MYRVIKLPIHVAVLAFVLLCSTASAQNDLTFDNTATVGVTPASSSKGIIYWTFDSYVKQFRERISSRPSGVSMTTALLIDPPLTFDKYLDEYRDYRGGPMSGLLGIDSFSLQNRLMQAFTGFLLVVFVGIAVMSGLHKVATGQGDLNYVQIGLKFFFGLFVIFYPQFLYATVRTIQTGGMWAAQIALSSTGQAGTDSALMKNLNNASFVAQDAEAVFLDAIEQVNADFGPYYKLNSTADVITGLETKWNLAATNSAVTSPVLPAITVPGPTDDVAATRAAAEMISKYREIMTRNTELRKPDGSGSVDKAIDKYLAAVKATPANAKTLRTELLAELKTLLSKKTYDIYPVQTGLAAFLTGAVNKTFAFWTWVANTVNDMIAWLLIPVAGWVLVRLSCLILELTLVVTIITYPLWFLDATKRAFIGTFNTLFMTAIMPTVGTILLLIFENVAAAVYAGLMLGMAGPQILILNFSFIVFWLVGVIVLVWKTPSISKAILEGGAFVGQFLGALATAGVTAALAGAGLAGSLQSMALPGVTEKGAAEGTKSVADKVPADTKAGGAGADLTNEIEGNAPDIAGAGGRTPEPSQVGKNVLNSTGQEKRSGMENELEAKKHKEASAGVGGTSAANAEKVGASSGAQVSGALPDGEKGKSGVMDRVKSAVNAVPGVKELKEGASIGDAGRAAKSGEPAPHRTLRELPQMKALSPASWGERAKAHLNNAGVILNPVAAAGSAVKSTGAKAMAWAKGEDLKDAKVQERVQQKTRLNPYAKAGWKAAAEIAGKTAVAAVISGGDSGKMAQIAGASMVSKKLGIDMWGNSKKDGGKIPGQWS